MDVTIITASLLSGNTLYQMVLWDMVEFSNFIFYIMVLNG